MSQSGQRTTWPQAGHWMCVEKPRRFSSRITCPPSSSAAAIAWCSCRLIAPRVCRRRSSHAQVDRAHGRQRPVRAPAAASRPAGTRRVCARCQLSSDGVAEPSTSGTSSAAARRDGHVAGVIARRRLLLERRLVLFVEHDQPQVRRGGEDRAAGARPPPGPRRRRSAASASAARRRSGGCAARPPRRTARGTARPSAASG